MSAPPNPATSGFVGGGGATVGSEVPGEVRASMSNPYREVLQLNIEPDEARWLASALTAAADRAER